MIDTTIFHIYEKATDKPVKVCLTVDELEQMLAKHEVDFVLKFLKDLKRDLRRNPKHKVPKHPFKDRYKRSSSKG